MKKLLTLLVLLSSVTILNARQITLKISYKGIPACNQTIDLKVGDVVVASGITNKQGELKTNLTFGVNDVDVSGKKGNASWYAKGMVHFQNNYYHLKLEVLEKLMKEEIGNAQDDLNTMGGIGSMAGGLLNSATTNMFNVTDKCKSSSMSNSAFGQSSAPSKKKSGFSMTSSSRSTKTINGVVVEDERTNSSISNEGFSSSHSKYENGEYNERTIESGETTTNISETASLIGETASLVNVLKLSPEEKAIKEKAKKEAKIVKLQKKLDNIISDKAKKEVELKSTNYDREEEKQVVENEIKLLEIDKKLQEHELIKYRDNKDKLSATERAELEAEYEKISKENDLLKENIKIADSGVSGIGLSKLKINLASKKAKLKMTLNKKKKSKLQEEIEELENQIQDIEKMKEE